MSKKNKQPQTSWTAISPLCLNLLVTWKDPSRIALPLKALLFLPNSFFWGAMCILITSWLPARLVNWWHCSLRGPGSILVTATFMCGPSITWGPEQDGRAKDHPGYQSCPHISENFRRCVASNTVTFNRDKYKAGTQFNKPMTLKTVEETWLSREVLKKLFFIQISDGKAAPN